jgi:OOP family OmpA-OmpF porin
MVASTKELVMRKFLPAIVLVLAGSAAHAADGYYVGAAVGKSNLDNLYGADFSLHSNDASWKAIVGFRPVDFFAVEANYLDFGSQSRDFGIGTASANAKAFAAYGMALLPMPILDLFAKAGVARWQLEGNIAGAGQLFSFNDRGTQFAYGAGWQANWGAIAARFEYDGFEIKHTDGLSMYSLGVIWTFL